MFGLRFGQDQLDPEEREVLNDLEHPALGFVDLGTLLRFEGVNAELRGDLVEY
ncbi:hypothetical protein D3C83_315710 [compost metagenome]